VLDALLQDRTVWLLNTLGRNENHQIIHNLYQPKQGQILNLIKGTRTDSF